MRMRRSDTLGLVTVTLTLSGWCGCAPPPRDARAEVRVSPPPQGPREFLDRQLVEGRATSIKYADGGFVFQGCFDERTTRVARTPVDLMRTRCEAERGTFSKVRSASASALETVRPTATPALLSALEAEQEQAFGVFVCSGGSATPFTLHVEPRAYHAESRVPCLDQYVRVDDNVVEAAPAAPPIAQTPPAPAPEPEREGAGDAPPEPEPVAESPPEPPAEDETALKELASRIHVQHPEGYFSTEALQMFAARNVGPDTLQHLANTKDALYVDSGFSALGNGRMYCFASIGLTESAQRVRNARLPSTDYLGARLILEGEDQSAEGVRLCRVYALEKAAQLMNRDTLAQQLANIERTRSKGVRKAGEKPDPTNVFQFSKGGLSDAVRKGVFAAIPSDHSRAFDYRKLMWVASAYAFRLQGRTVCRGEVGVSARAPQDRNPRAPGHTWYATRELSEEATFERDAEDNCKSAVLTSAIESASQASWDKNGLLSGFEVTREDGLPLVVPLKRPKPPVAKAPPPPVYSKPAPTAAKLGAKCQPPRGKVLRYSDRCSNGDCTRTFENGCSIRFQAPYCYDALSGGFTWKPDGC